MAGSGAVIDVCGVITRVIRDAEDRIRGLGYFSTVAVNVRDGSGPGRAIVDVEGFEEQTQDGEARASDALAVLRIDVDAAVDDHVDAGAVGGGEP